MFSSVFNKVVSATAPGAMATFPPFAALPVPPSTLCCLSFVDQFLSHYPVAPMQTTKESGNDTNLRLVGRAGVDGVALSTNELDSVMQRAAELGGRLAAALAGTARSKPREAGTVRVSELLAKVHGIFGNRLTCVGRDIRVSRTATAEMDETLLLRQIHTLKSAALEICNGQKWCIVISSGGESLAVCAVPLPPTQGEGAYGCDFLVFDPWPRPAMKLRGSYIVKFTTVRGLQLHLLSALGEIWKEGSRSKENAVKDEFVILSVVMEAQTQGQERFDAEARVLLEESVMRLRKAEKATTIKIKRDEVEALRRVLKESRKRLPDTKDVGVVGIGRTDDASKKYAGVCSDLGAGSASPYSTRRGERLREASRESMEWADLLDDENSTADKATKQVESYDATSTVEPIHNMVDSSMGYVDANGERKRYIGVRVAGDRCAAVETPPLRPLVAVISPPLPATWSRRSEIRDLSGEREEYSSERGQGPNPATGTRGEQRIYDEALGKKAGHAERFVETLASKDPFNRALLRSVESEVLANYSKRAYNVCRTHGILHHDALDVDRTLDSRRPPSPVDPFLTGPAPAASLARTTDARLRDNIIDSCEIFHEDEASSRVIQRGMLRPFPPPSRAEATQQSDAFLVNGGFDGAVLECPGGDDGIHLVDVSQPEEAVPSCTVLSALQPPQERFRSRLKTPCTGRALTLTSANAKGDPTRTKKVSRAPRLDFSGNPLPPPPPTINVSGHRVNMQNNNSSLRVPRGVLLAQRRAKREVLRFGKATNGFDLVRGENKTGKRIVPASFSRRNCNSQPHVTSENESQRDERGGDVQCFVRPVASRDHDLPTVEPPRQQKIVESRRGFVAALPVLESKENDGSARNPNGRSGRADWGYGEDRDERTKGVVEENSGNLAVIPFPPAKSPSRVETKTNRSVATNSTRSKCGYHRDGLTAALQPGVPSLTTIQDGEGVISDQVEHVCPMIPDTLITEGIAENTEARDDATFVWFGQPESPTSHRSGEIIEGVATADVAGSARSGWISTLQHQRDKARFLLRMEVQRQRNIIEREFQAREKERRIRRVKLGAEVLRRFQDLRRNAEPTQLQFQGGEPLCHTHPGEGARGIKTLTPGITTFRHDRQSAVVSKGLKYIPNTVEASATRVESDMVPIGLEETKGTEGRRTGGDERHKPQDRCAPQTVADDPSGRLSSQVKHEEFPVTRAPAPPPIRFDITGDGIPVEEGETGTSREQARRKDHLEALRARKMAESEVRRYLAARTNSLGAS